MSLCTCLSGHPADYGYSVKAASESVCARIDNTLTHNRTTDDAKVQPSESVETTGQTPDTLIRQQHNSSRRSTDDDENGIPQVFRQTHVTQQVVCLWVGAKGVINFPWLFFFMQCGV